MREGNADPKNPFPKWATRLDPLLSAGESNHWFHLIRDLRRGDVQRRWSTIATWLILAVFLWIIWQHASQRQIPSIATLVGLGVLYAAMIVIGFLTARRRRGGVPVYLSQLVLSPRQHRQGLMDLWLSGCDGRRLLEAGYLEQREGVLRFWMVFFVAAVPASVYYFWRFGMGPLPSLAWWCNVIFLVSWFFYYAQGGGSMFFPRFARIISSLWREGAHASLMRTSMRLTLPFLIPVYGIMLFYYMIPRAMRPGEYLFLYFAVLGLGGTALLLYRTWRRVRPSAEEHELILAEADAALDTLVREHLGDES